MKVSYNDFEHKIRRELLTSAKNLDNESIVRILFTHAHMVHPALKRFVEKGQWLNPDLWVSCCGQYRVEMVREEEKEDLSESDQPESNPFAEASLPTRSAGSRQNK